MRTSFEIKTGTEGPRYDPYGYEEIIFNDSHGNQIILHRGLGEYLNCNGHIIKEHETECINERFFELTGYYPKQIRKFWVKLKYPNKCRKCGCRNDFDTVKGFPGETLLICQRCGEIISVDFDESVII